MKKLSIFFIYIISAASVYSQSSYVIAGGKEEQAMERVEIKMRSKFLTSSNHPLMRSKVVHDFEQSDSLSGYFNSDAEMLTDLDIQNMRNFLMANSEFSKPKSYYVSDRPLFNIAYKNKANMVEIRSDNFVLITNPIIQYKYIKEKDNDQYLYQNSRGVTTRGIIGNKVGFNVYFTENQERLPMYMQHRISQFQAVPGAGFYKNFKDAGGVDYFEIRTSASFKVASFMDAQLGYDKNFIGDGHRSLFISDYGNNAMFLKLQTNYKWFSYQNLFMELTAPHTNISNIVYPRKYARMSHLTIHPNKWLSFGLFEGLLFNKTSMPVKMFNPVMYTNFKSKEDESYVGADIKMNLAHKLQIYGQAVIQDLNLKNTDKYNNRYGYQAGIKYIDVLGINHMDLQLETNSVRPFMYATNNAKTNYTHYNLPIAHPLGSNFQEFIAILRIQPSNKVYMQLKAVYYKQGLDSNNVNFGNNPFRFVNTRPMDENWQTGEGDKATVFYASGLLSVELKENLFLDINAVLRDYKTIKTGENNTWFLSAGLRLNMRYREFDF